MARGRTILKLLGALLLVAALGIAGLFGTAAWVARRTYPVAPLGIARATSPAALARGAYLFDVACVECHVDPATGLATGLPMNEVPAFIGRFYTANLTAHPEAGIGRRTDDELARAIRVGLRPDGTVVGAMPRFAALGDEDVAALIGHLRSGAAPFVPSARRQPPSELTLAGKVIAMLFMKPALAGARRGVPVPAKAATVAYGRYMADEVYHCWECHTAGFDPDKRGAPGFYGGGFEFGTGAEAVVSPNLTSDPTGLADWTVADLERALREGVSRDGTILREPMRPRRRIDPIDVQAIHAYLRTVPKVARALPAGARPRARPRAGQAPAELFARLGCVACHGEGKPFREKLRGAAGKPVAEVARWIRNPQELKPDTPMPTFASVLDEAEALRLAAWLQQQLPAGAP